MSYSQSLEDLARLQALALGLASVLSLKSMSSAAVFSQILVAKNSARLRGGHFHYTPGIELKNCCYCMSPPVSRLAVPPTVMRSILIVGMPTPPGPAWAS